MGSHKLEGQTQTYAARHKSYCKSCNSLAATTTSDPRRSIACPAVAQTARAAAEFSCVCDTSLRHMIAVGRQPEPELSSLTACLPKPDCIPREHAAVYIRSGYCPCCLKKKTHMVKGPPLLPAAADLEECALFGGCWAGSDKVGEVHGWSTESTEALACDACFTHPACTGWAVTSTNNRIIWPRYSPGS